MIAQNNAQFATASRLDLSDSPGNHDEYASFQESNTAHLSVTSRVLLTLSEAGKTPCLSWVFCIS